MAEGKDEEKAYPRIVRQMLTRRSAPQPATIQTPRGGTVDLQSQGQLFLGSQAALIYCTVDTAVQERCGKRLTDDGDNHHQDR